MYGVGRNHTLGEHMTDFVFRDPRAPTNRAMFASRERQRVEDLGLVLQDDLGRNPAEKNPLDDSQGIRGEGHDFAFQVVCWESAQLTRIIATARDEGFEQKGVLDILDEL